MSTRAEHPLRDGRIAFYSPAWPPGHVASGIVSYVAAVRSGLARLGIGSVVVAGESAGPETDDVISVSTAYPRLGTARRLSIRALGRVAPRRASVERLAAGIGSALQTLQLRGPVPILEIEESFGLGAFVRRHYGGRIVVRIHGPWFLTAPALGMPDDAKYRERVAWERRSLLEADAVSAPSQLILDRVRSELGIDLRKAVVIPNPAPEVPVAERWSLEACDRNLLVFVGRFDRLKGADLVVQAFRQVAESWPEARLAIVGPDRGLVDENGRSWSAAGYLRAALPGGLHERVQVVGAVAPEMAASLRRRAFLTLVASRQENFPMALLEAMAQGCPVIAPRVGGIPDMVEEGRSGLLFKAGDAGDLARRILEAAFAPERAAALGSEAAGDASSRFHLATVAGALRSLYSTVLAD